MAVNSDWTFTTLKLYLDTRIDALTQHTDDRFQESQLARVAALDAQEKAVNAALLTAKEAVQKAEIASEKRFDSVNAFRQTLTDYQALLMPRNEVMVLIAGLTEKLDAQAKEIVSLREGRSDTLGRHARSAELSSGFFAVMTLLIGVATIIAGIVGYSLH